MEEKKRKEVEEQKRKEVEYNRKLEAEKQRTEVRLMKKIQEENRLKVEANDKIRNEEAIFHKECEEAKSKKEKEDAQSKRINLLSGSDKWSLEQRKQYVSSLGLFISAYTQEIKFSKDGRFVFVCKFYTGKFK